MRFDMWKSKAQKGAFLVVAALMVPVFFLFGALAMDLGEIWAYHSKMQNAVDAAALAGAGQFNEASGDQILDSIDTANHKHADENAKVYLSQNLGDSLDQLNAAESNHMLLFQAQKTDDSHSYYRVEYTKPIPLMLLRYLKIGDFNVKAAAVALLPTPGKETSMVTFDNLIYAGNEIGGSYYNGFLNNISATFDGHVVMYNDYEYKLHLGQFAPDDKKNLYRLPTLNARGKQANQLDKNDPNYYQNVINGARDENGNLIHITDEDGYWVDSYTYFNKKVIKSIQNIFSSGNITQLSGKSEYIFLKDEKVTPDYSVTSDYYFVSGDNQHSQTVDLLLGAIPGTKPVYIYLDDPYVTQIHLKIEGDVGANGNRPIIFCYTGNNADVKFDGRGDRSYRGVIYAPYSKNLGPFNNITQFRGSMVANNIELSTNNMDYRFEEFGIPGGGSSGGNSGSSTGTALRLVENDEVSWPETHHPYLIYQ